MEERWCARSRWSTNFSSVSDLLEYRLEGGVAVLVFDDGKANVLRAKSIAALHAALDRAEKEAASVALVGRPGRFSAGFDLSVMGSNVDAMRALVRSGVELLLRIWEFPRPFLAVCTGHAVAGGAMLLLTADYRLGVEGDWKIGLNEVSIGMPLPIFAIELARARLDPRLFTQSTLLGKTYDGQAAVTAGYLDEVVPADSLLERGMELATQAAALETSGFAPSKARVRRTLADYVRSTLDADIASITMPKP